MLGVIGLRYGSLLLIFAFWVQMFSSFCCAGLALRADERGKVFGFMDGLGFGGWGLGFMV